MPGIGAGDDPQRTLTFISFFFFLSFFPYFFFFFFLLLFFFISFSLHRLPNIIIRNVFGAALRVAILFQPGSVLHHSLQKRVCFPLVISKRNEVAISSPWTEDFPPGHMMDEQIWPDPRRANHASSSMWPWAENLRSWLGEISHLIALITKREAIPLLPNTSGAITTGWQESPALEALPPNTVSWWLYSGNRCDNVSVCRGSSPAPIPCHGVTIGICGGGIPFQVCWFFSH